MKLSSDTRPVIRAEKLGKSYTIVHRSEAKYRTIRDEIADGVKLAGRRLLGSPRTRVERETFWALKDTSFEVGRGERLGVIGRNGAGKSTLLKLLSRITEPTTGSISLRGRVASLLEVGTGFHPELTGRENVFLNGSILGMSRNDIRRKFDEIVAFSEVEQFIDTPVKRYSSGMYVRLAFAVAAHLEPEILLVDEVLAVGDLQFQRKCLGKMESVSAEGGRTVLFVSHNMAAISSLCPRCMYLSKGSVEYIGNTSDAILSYYTAMGGSSPAQVIYREGEHGDDIVTLVSGRVEAGGDVPLQDLTIHDAVTVCMTYRVAKCTDATLVPNFHFYRADGTVAFVTCPADLRPGADPGRYDARMPYSRRPAQRRYLLRRPGRDELHQERG